MEKKSKQIPIYEEKKVQVGTKEVDIWVTLDGSEFYNPSQAEDHEFKLKIKERQVFLPYDVKIYYFENENQVKEWIERLDDGYHQALFDKSNYNYPNWFVIYDVSGEHDWMTYYDMKPLEDFKHFIIQEIDKLTE
ncbi:hypothetical protein EDM57_04640 [Brevibacillus gelatini]|uniref:Uncharacterized protein n=1 Tax=Brevibacillus gelatini TaxID=1655277 RepID=A0A3M8B7L2_9BACL|nr:hypothetical protein [Brevibacillus gelatini]RNB59434.1 hypothetical protein EDM57_04640 [Brevibacillus gelatini]